MNGVRPGKFKFNTFLVKPLVLLLMELISTKRILQEFGLAQTRLDDLNYFFFLSHTIR